MSSPEEENKTLADYASVLADFDQSKDFVLQGVREALQYAPTFALADGSHLRPLNSDILVRKRQDEDSQRFDLVCYREACHEIVTHHEPETTWAAN